VLTQAGPCSLLGLPGLEAFDMSVANILRVYDGASAALRAAGATWYPTAARVCRALAWAHGLEPWQVAGAVAALSPSNRWERNLKDAALLLLGQRCGFHTYPQQVLKALACLSAQSLDAVEDVLRGPKTRAFAVLLTNPGADRVVVDGHALCVYRGDRRVLASCHVSPKQYRDIEAAYRTAADWAGVAPAVMQATTWLAWRAAHATGALGEVTQ
jgi:hypothetical protein